MKCSKLFEFIHNYHYQRITIIVIIYKPLTYFLGFGGGGLGSEGGVVSSEGLVIGGKLVEGDTRNGSE